MNQITLNTEFLKPLNKYNLDEQFFEALKALSLTGHKSCKGWQMLRAEKRFKQMCTRDRLLRHDQKVYKHEKLNCFLLAC